MTDERREMMPGPGAQTERDDAEERERAATMNDRISVGSGDENVAKIQLASRWAEQYAPDTGDTLDEMLRRFKRAYNYVDSVTKLVDPDE